jgi:hypothetical protein
MATKDTPTPITLPPLDAMTELGPNVRSHIHGRTLILAIDLDQEHGETASGNPVVGKTDSFTPFPGAPGLKLSCMVMKPLSKKEKAKKEREEAGN